MGYVVRYSAAIFIVERNSLGSNIAQSLSPNNDTHIMAKNCWVFGDLINLQ